MLPGKLILINGHKRGVVTKAASLHNNVAEGMTVIYDMNACFMFVTQTYCVNVYRF